MVRKPIQNQLVLWITNNAHIPQTPLSRSDRLAVFKHAMRQKLEAYSAFALRDNNDSDRIVALKPNLTMPIMSPFALSVDRSE